MSGLYDVAVLLLCVVGICTVLYCLHAALERWIGSIIEEKLKNG